MSCGKLAPVGDRGQRYEVRCFKRDTGEEFVLGWTDAADGGSLMEGAKIWPAMRDPFIVDRQAGSPPAEGGEG